MKILELFGGIGACTAALKRLGIDFEVVDYVEIDKYACASYNAMNGTNFEPQDVCTWDKDVKVDLIMHGSPCQDFSVAGKQAGGNEGSGTRSSLMYETLRIVKNLLSAKHKHNFDNYINQMEQLGYTSFYQVLNAKDYGIPQNRERVFTISILENEVFEFPEKQSLRLRLKDILENEVDKKYYLSETQIKNYIKNGNCNPSGKGMNGKVSVGNMAPSITTNKGEGIKVNLIQVGQIYGTEREPNPQAGRIYDVNGLSPTMDSCSGGNRMPKILELPCIAASRGRNPDNISDRRKGLPTEQRLEFNQKGISNTLTSVLKDNYVIETHSNYVNKKYQNFVNKNGYIPEYFNPYNEIEIKNVAPTQTSGCGSSTSSSTILINNQVRIRKLTPKECWRLMGFSDEDFEKAAQVCSNSQLYKQAGNSIVVNVLEKIFKNLFEEKRGGA